MSNPSVVRSRLLSDAWRNPSLWRALCDGPELSEEELARHTIELLACPHEPARAWDVLVANDALEAAEELLHNANFLAALGSGATARVRDWTTQLRQLRLRRLAAARAEQHLARQQSAGSASDALDGEDTVPPLRIWPFDEPLETACRMLLGERDAPAVMARGWMPDPQDNAAKELLEALFFAREAQLRADVSGAELILSALDGIFGVRGNPEVEDVAGFLVGYSQGLWNPDVPALSPSARPKGVPVALPTEDADPDVLEQALPGLFVCFDPAGLLARRPRNALALPADLLLSAVGISADRPVRLRVQLSRGLRDLLLAIPVGWQGLAPAPGQALHGEERFRTELEALLDATHVQVEEGEAPIALATFYAGPWPSVGWALVRRALWIAQDAVDTGPVKLTTRMVTEAWMDRSVEQAVEEMEERCVAGDPTTRDVLDALLEDSATDPEAGRRGFMTCSVETLATDLGIADIDPERVSAALDKLVDSGLLRRVEGNRVGLVDRGTVWRLLERIQVG